MDRGRRADGGDAVVPVRRAQSLATMVVDQIRDLIVTGRLDLGEQLSENALAERLDVSRTPVREAFMRLASEGLVEVRPQRGTFVFTCDEADVREICELREVLETGALRIALAHDRAALISALRAEAVAAAGVPLETALDFTPLDAAFHRALVSASRNRQLIATYAGIAGRVWALRSRFVRRLAEVESSRADHARILCLIASGDDHSAEERLREHVYNSYRAYLRRGPDRGDEQ